VEQTLNKASASSEGFLLLNANLNPIFVNRAGAEILSYPHKLDNNRNVDQYLAYRVRASLVSSESSHVPALVPEFISGRRLYLCRAYRVNALAQGDAQGSLAVILERGSNGSFSIGQISNCAVPISAKEKSA
jgi:hypothetical protein